MAGIAESAAAACLLLHELTAAAIGGGDQGVTIGD